MAKIRIMPLTGTWPSGLMHCPEHCIGALPCSGIPNHQHMKYVYALHLRVLKVEKGGMKRVRFMQVKTVRIKLIRPKNIKIFWVSISLDPLGCTQTVKACVQNLNLCIIILDPLSIVCFPLQVKCMYIPVLALKGTL